MATTKVDPAELEARVLASVSELSKMPQPLDLGMTFADLNMDSLDVVEILQMVEDDFGITVSDREAAGVETLGQALDLLRSKVPSAS
jgi:acyl carrier protein